MEKQKVVSADIMLKKTARPKSSILSRILNGTSATRTANNSSITTTENSSSNDNDNDDEIISNKCSSNKLEILNREQYLMTTSFLTPTDQIATYTQLRSEYDTLTQALHPENHLDNTITINNQQEIKIPSRHQSNLYTPYHDRSEFTVINPTTTLNINDSYHNKRRSHYLTPPIDTSMVSNNTSSLSRSATWQPTSSSLSTTNNNTNMNDNPSSRAAVGEESNNINHTDIPARRTSRNYANNPEIQAKLDAMLRSDKTIYLSKTLGQQQRDDSLLDTNSNVRRRSTTPGHI